MKKIHGALISLGFGIQNPDVLFRIGNPGKVFFQDHLYSKHDDRMSDSSSGSPVHSPDVLLRVADVGDVGMLDEPDCDSGGESDKGPPEDSCVKREDVAERLSLGEDGQNSLTCDNESIIYCIPTETVNLNIIDKSTAVQSNDCQNRVGTVTIDNVEHGTLQGDGSVLCAKCGGRFCNLSAFVVHQTVHLESAQDSDDIPAQSDDDMDTKLYKCNQCEKCFRQNSGLLKHQRSHTGEKPYQCTHCSKRFSRSSSLCMHKRIHTGEKPYICTFCEKCFSQSSSLIKHQRTHTGERPYPCMYCGKTFTQKQHFVGHQRTHTGERPFTCTECGESFNRKEMLNKHQTLHKVIAESEPVELDENVVCEDVIPEQQVLNDVAP